MKTRLTKGLTDLEILAKEHALYPQESLLMVKENNNRLLIGIPKEKEAMENRVALTPEAVALLVNNGHEIVVEAGAGESSKFSDQEYSEAGAKIEYSPQEVFSSDVVLKIEPPTLEELSYMKSGKTLISALQTGNLSTEFLHTVMRNKIIAIA